MHPALKFTCEHEADNKLPFLDVLSIHYTRSDSSTFFSTTVYRKPTFTGQYTRWDSFSPRQYKINSIKSLSNRAIKICSPDQLDLEVDELKRIFANNSYPVGVANQCMTRMLSPSEPKIGPKKCPVYLRLTWLGNRTAEAFEKKDKQAVSRFHYACERKSLLKLQANLPICCERS